jgi:hypothetical protein
MFRKASAIRRFLIAAVIALSALEVLGSGGWAFQIQLICAGADAASRERGARRGQPLG